ncbi:FAD-dependent oxidoreductase [Azospirillum picis]|uniref:Choline dehydrogenase-like flavoprotein n=1 Tax=Azospirillum picis TaxID=488438 RepID=A0ABU0MN67_9PROT|nr:GMC family oxidoreductase [Azospirillum picis]MBP2301138.1 choline dehydrogenase-like flavoprotein [Azospirillum picis]MDQ0534900.1 choline dehydrogenase-like flavoprotein [Azospirillum picis]
MLLDLRELAGTSSFETGLCIVGAGAAGVTLARQMLARGHEVMLVESGGVDFEADVQALAAGSTSGQPYYDLGDVNLRMVGGTTPIWGGRCAELESIDFAQRSWVPHSGWPITRDEMEPYYVRAAGELSIARPDAGRDALMRTLPILRRLETDGLRVGCWSFDDRRNRYTLPNIRDVADHPKARLLVHATATGLALSDDGRRILSVTVRDVGGREAVIRAGRIVLALGGLETPRLMLASNEVAPAGIGNGRDLVGRFFMEHPHARGGRLETTASWPLLAAFGRSHRVGGTRHAALLGLQEEEQTRSQTLNSAFTLGARQGEREAQFWAMKSYNAMKHRLNPSALNRRLWRGVKDTALWVHERVDPLRPWALVRSGARQLAMIMRAEQAPNPDSRLTLTADRDALGMPRAELDWRLTELDKHTVRVMVARMDSALKRLGLGAAVPSPWLEDPATLWYSDPLISAHPLGGYHHMGTVRMADDPARGVVDRNGKVHGVENLYVAGSAVFPTSGWANPTFTILALALRMGDHLDQLAPAAAR